MLLSLILMGADLRMFLESHAFVVIFGGSFAATLIRFPLTSNFRGLPLGAKFAFTMRRMTQRDLVDELAGLADIARKQGPIGLETSKTLSSPREFVLSPTPMIPASSATISNATSNATIF